MEIIADDREKAVIPFMEDISEKFHINYKVQRNTVGDYVIAYKGYILLIIERKTWEDLSASMRDGRKANIEKLTKLRESTGCQVAYLIEGNATPAADKKYGRLPVKNLRAHLDHLAFRDGVHMIYSKDAQYTAYRLFELAQNYFSIKETIKEIDALEKAENKTSTNEISKVQDKQASMVGVNEQILRCIPGVGSIISTLLAELGITLRSLYLGNHSDEEISRIKYPTGSAIGLEKGKRIANDTRKMIVSSSEANKKIHIRILTTIPLISKGAALKILETHKLSKIMSGDTTVDELASIQRTEKTKLGKKAAENIILYLCNVQDSDEDDEEAANDADDSEYHDIKRIDEPVEVDMKPKPVDTIIKRKGAR